jgi:hemerythrin
MAHIYWNKGLDTGIEVIDNQHRRIVDYINQLEDIKETHSREEVAVVLDELVDYTLSHFAFEESLMEEAGYPFINAHKRVHQLFVRRVSDYMQRFKIGEDITEELHNTLKAWLINHIRNDDNDYSEIVRSKLHTIDSRKGGGWLSRSLTKLFG